MRNVYMDYSATTPVKEEVLQEMLPYFTEKFGNPSSLYDLGLESKDAVTHAREQVAALIGAQPKEAFFTAGGTESDNWAVRGIAEMMKDKGRHIITSSIEHHAILNTCEYLEKHGFDITYLDVDDTGVISIEQLKKSIRADTILISIMFANNEIGTIEPVREIGRIAAEHNIYFHTDAVQAYMHVPIDVDSMNIDMMSASSHKFRGPKGVGFLYIRNGIDIVNFMYGGGQESGKRAGTENVAGIAGMGKAVEIGMRDMKKDMIYLRNMREYLYYRITGEIPYVRLNGSRTERLPGNLNISFKYVDGESLLIMLDMEGICASAGSACTAGSKETSNVLKAIGVPDDIAKGSLRITIGTDNTMDEMDIVFEKINSIVNTLRAFSDEYTETKV